ncbi:hypothetical protein [Novosphingobium sp. 17-62-19]|uniref:hypothetical protein n=1 Tax=Novosphingobium sp. 17-62-19 TaxID=1970406 RepID=UPI0025D6D28F|nr:hypothetical protein [Novosphingobium sp. 17-62-19]
MGHDFIKIYSTIPDEIKIKLNLRQYLCVFEEKNNIFAGKKYYYEDHPHHRGSDDTLLHAAGRMIPIIVNLFLDNGSDDPWLMCYRSEPGRFQLPTGISAVLRT